MKFGESFTEYLHGDQERFLEKCSHVEYKRLKKVLKSCRSCKAFGDSWNSECQCESCSGNFLFFYFFIFFIFFFFKF
jgi:E3 ubiquitin-protein ligase BAH